MNLKQCHYPDKQPAGIFQADLFFLQLEQESRKEAFLEETLQKLWVQTPCEAMTTTESNNNKHNINISYI